MNKLHHVHSAFATSLLLLGAALLVGCKDKEAEAEQAAAAARAAAAAAMIERYRAQGLAQLERIKRVGELVREREPLSADSRTLPFDNVSFDETADPPPEGTFAEAARMTEEGMQDDSYNQGVTIDAYPFWGLCRAYLTTGKNHVGETPYDAAAVEKALQAFLKLKYVGAARTVELRNPEAEAIGNDFNGGRYRFDLFFYELADPPKYLGGLRVDARNESELKFKYKESSRKEDVERRLVYNLQYQTQAELYRMINERAKGFTMREPKDLGSVEE